MKKTRERDDAFARLYFSDILNHSITVSPRRHLRPATSQKLIPDLARYTS